MVVRCTRVLARIGDPIENAPVAAKISRIASVCEHPITPGDEERHDFIVLRPEGLFPNIYLVGPIDAEPCIALDGRHEAVILTAAEQDIIGSALVVDSECSEDETWARAEPET